MQGRDKRLGRCRYASPSITTATDAEIFSLIRAPAWVANKLSKRVQRVDHLIFMSDSMAALRLVRYWRSTPGAHLLPQWQAGIRQLLDINPNLHITYQWSPGHSGIPGNEWADTEAKEATALAPTNAPPSISALREKNTLKAQAEWSQSLARATTSTADKYLAVSGPPTRRPRKLLTMSTTHTRKQIAAVAQVLCCAGPFGACQEFPQFYYFLHFLDYSF